MPDQTRKLLNTLVALTDSEVVLLAFYAIEPTRTEQAAFLDRHGWLREVLFAGNETGAPDGVRRARGLRDAYQANLLRLSLVDHGAGHTEVTAFGRMLLEFIGEPRTEEAVS